MTITNPENIIRKTITPKVNFKSHILRDLLTMASHYYYDKNVKQNELLSTMLEDLVDYYYEHKFINEIKR